MINEKKLRLAMLFMATVGSALAGSLTAPPAVELRGVCNLLDARCAIFSLSPTAADSNLVLAEGESQGGIKLIAVDMVANCVRIENGGQMQTLRLGGAANNNFSAAGDGGQFLARGTDGMVGTAGADGLVAEISPGNPGWGTLAPVVAGSIARPDAKAGTGQSSAPTQSGTATPNAAGSSAGATTTPTNSADNEWYQEALSLEQSRKDNAAQVLAGEQEPWPATPLTPPGTPAALVGKGMFFSNHLPHYVVTGSLNE